MRRPLPALPVAVALVLLTGCGRTDRDLEARADSRAEASSEANGVHLQTARSIARQYVRAISEREGSLMRSLLAPGPRSDASLDELAAVGAGLTSLEVRELEAEQVTEVRIVLRARLEAALTSERNPRWEPGDNVRWMELVHTRAGWRINRVSREPISDPSWLPVVTWTQVHVMEGQLSIDVPNAWHRRSDRWVWAPASRGLPEVGVTWRDAVPGVDPLAMLPDDAVMVRTDSLGVGWGPHRVYTIERHDGDEGVEVIHEQHVIVGGAEDGRLYGFYSRARSREELGALAPVLRRMSSSAERDTSASLFVRGRRLECPGVLVIPVGSRQGRIIARELLEEIPAAVSAGFVPPDPLEIEWFGPIERVDDWLFVQAGFRGSPQAGLFVLRVAGGRYRWAGVGWAGEASDERQIREHLARSFPDAPGALLRCGDLSRWVGD